MDTIAHRLWPHLLRPRARTGRCTLRRTTSPLLIRWAWRACSRPSFAQTSEWPQYFSTQDVLLDYFRACADEFGVRDRVRFETEVLEAAWSDAEQHWDVTVRANGVTEIITADALVSAVGQLNQPNLPDIPGRERFDGESFHSARWDWSVELAGKRVAIIGTGQRVA